MPGDPPQPHVVIVGGFLTEPVFYWPMRRRLLERGAARVSIAPLHLPDWLAMGIAGLRPSMLRAARAIREARSESPAPLLVVGHSAGGILARLAMSAEPFDGPPVGVSDEVGCLVTLGTPHSLHDTIPVWHHPGVVATEFLELMSPGACFVPTTGYLTVGSTFVRHARRVPIVSLKQVINVVVRTLVGHTPGAPGDGIVGNDICRLAGARHLALPDVLHGTFGGPWYGDGHVIDRWWPVALEEWQAALAARGSRVLDAAPDAGRAPMVPLAANVAGIRSEGPESAREGVG